MDYCKQEENARAIPAIQKNKSRRAWSTTTEPQNKQVLRVAQRRYVARLLSSRACSRPQAGSPPPPNPRAKEGATITRRCCRVLPHYNAPTAIVKSSSHPFTSPLPCHRSCHKMVSPLHVSTSCRYSMSQPADLSAHNQSVAMAAVQRLQQWLSRQCGTTPR